MEVADWPGIAVFKILPQVRLTPGRFFQMAGQATAANVI
jgi:hypothetical protein